MILTKRETKLLLIPILFTVSFLTTACSDDSDNSKLTDNPNPDPKLIPFVQEKVEVVTEFETPARAGNGIDNIDTPLLTYNGSTYFIWEDEDFRPYITKITNGNVDTRPLDPTPDYHALPNDGHNRFSIGVDENGYLHVAGDMHNYPGNQSHLPERYQNKENLYWVSDSPEDISSFSFKGGDPSTALAHTKMSYLGFFNDNYGKLYLKCRIEVLKANEPSKYGVALSSYNANKKKWTALGGIVTPPKGATDRKVILWENSGHADVTFYQHMMTSITFDKNNRLHFICTINNDITKLSATHIVYGYSDDGGISWHKASGEAIPSLPLRAKARPMYGGSQGDIAFAPNGTNDVRFDQGCFVFVDRNGTPAASVTPIVNEENTGAHYVYYNTQEKKWSGLIPSPAEGGYKKRHITGPDGVITYFGNRKIFRTNAFDSEDGQFTDVLIAHGLVCPDELGLKQTGILRFIARLPGGKLGVAKLNITPLEDSNSAD